MDVSNILIVTDNETELLDQFLSSAGASLNSFRYFQSRPLSVLKNHIVTCLFIENGQPVGYGHLDKEGNKVWLGIAVSELFKGKGIGTQIMNFLVLKARDNNIDTLNLSVDAENLHAIQLYKKFGFIVIDAINEKSILMQLKYK